MTEGDKLAAAKVVQKLKNIEFREMASSEISDLDDSFCEGD